ncbi:MAG TPA: hypothetical protein VHP64_02670 [Candidatus Limnocylindria bacterium]|nr:hypothetical protein [Candidatus Limnocylindria bacterium]
MTLAGLARFAPALAMAVVLTACAGVPSPTGSAGAEPPASARSPSMAASATASTGPAAGEPGRPFDAAEILDAMRDSRRPGGVPEELQTDAIATALAEQVWTFDGRPWTSVVAGGSCGAEACTLELSGAGPEAAGEDVWVFDIDPSDGSVSLASADLHAVPSALAASLDELARATDGEGLLDGLIVTSVRWLPPPDDGRFVLAYRSGEEEGSCVRDVTVDAARATAEIGAGSGC